MKSKREELVNDYHVKYTSFLIRQLIIDLDKGEKVEILVNGKKEHEYIAIYDNSHINLVFQAKEGKISL